MMKVFYLFKVSFEKSIKELVRYKFNTISDILSFYFLFIAMFFGVKLFGASMNVSPVSLGDTLEGFVVGYFLWIIMIMVYSDTAYSITNDASRGTLEQISMSNLGLQSVLIVRSISNLIINFLICYTVLVSIMATTNYWLKINVGQLLILVLLGIFSILGIALVFGGLALIFKKVQSLLNIVQYFLIVLVLPGQRTLGSLAASILPFRPTIDKVYQTILGEQSLSAFPLTDYVILIGNSAVYFIIGLLVFNRCSKIARKRGLLGQY
ncbi:hypothetical protein [Abyssisolibacter fermentans]|uniref:hypothetical protein n=1 Tax=Abyssisolibacter fermentans TaxID=1766203 RepID=UPI00082C0B23|nr:hypothetical protein [Abyssisolibacter fermentans]